MGPRLSGQWPTEWPERLAVRGCHESRTPGPSHLRGFSGAWIAIHRLVHIRAVGAIFLVARRSVELAIDHPVCRIFTRPAEHGKFELSKGRASCGPFDVRRRERVRPMHGGTACPASRCKVTAGKNSASSM